MAVSQAHRLEAYEALTSAAGRKAAGTIMDELKDTSEGIFGLNHKVDMLNVRMAGLEKSFDNLANWNRVMFAMIFSVSVATLVLVFQMR